MHKGFKPQFEQFDNRLILDKNSINHFKPIQTKKNSRPRINKLNKNEQLLLKVSSDIRRSSIQKNKKIEYCEKSLDELFQHFQKVMNIEKPIRNGNLEMGIDYQLKVKNDLESKLLDLFIHRLSKSIDIFLPDEIFKRIIPELSLYDETGMILDSIFCLSSLIFQRSAPDKIDPSIPVKYYHQSIRSIRYYLSIPGIEDNDKGIFSRCLLSTIILCVYELFFVAVDSTYIKGASSILSTILSKNKNESILKNSPFHQTCFWAMFFSDLILSLKYDLPSMYSSDKFWKPLDPEYFEKYNRPKMAKLNYDKYISDLTLNKEDTIWWLYKSLLNYSSINEFNNQVEVITKQDFENNTPFKEWLKLKSKLDEFESYMPLNLKPTIYKPSSNTRVFPIIFFKDEMTAVLVLNYKLSKIALYEALILKPNQNDDLVKNQIANYPPDYRQKIAKDIIGILMTYDSNINVWSVNVHTLRQLAKYVGKDPETHKGWQNLVERVIRLIHLRFEVHQ
ncbi:hypothetical protein HYPBUDRAFT_103488 [Hyphopichia burtonii NRRL Y-1933]|uniref:Uncharacterized protein n=1 Tax=Hyphopichia burtonii NRRL Y-1933 TaxID=984485 RepID=A0A1E4RPW9_9ASCO|nr:hypothetical protein HYPBUDRAFT_103488 [Hyphopichia burtonii NRRL Y-1933]ODV69251.1 hypothetical protein HYPBUDRAFT_103488 [Hyphopichia burtonii NRRL Y-1933]